MSVLSPKTVPQNSILKLGGLPPCTRSSLHHQAVAAWLALLMTRIYWLLYTISHMRRIIKRTYGCSMGFCYQRYRTQIRPQVFVAQKLASSILLWNEDDNTRLGTTQYHFLYLRQLKPPSKQNPPQVHGHLGKDTSSTTLIERHAQWWRMVFLPSHAGNK